MISEMGRLEKKSVQQQRECQDILYALTLVR